MNYMEFGSGCNEKIIFLHGGGLSWWNYRKSAALLQNDFNVILPMLDGHSGSDRHFTSIEENASEIISFIDDKFGGSVLLIGGLSLGAQILLEMMSQRSDICSYSVVESAAVIPSPVTNLLVDPAFGASYGLIKNKAFAKTQFKSLNIDPDLFEDYYRDTCNITKQDMIAFMKANTAYKLKDSIEKTSAEVFVFCGGKETRKIRRSSTAISRSIPGCKTVVKDNYRHGEFSINHPEDYSDTVRSIIQNKFIQ